MPYLTIESFNDMLTNNIVSFGQLGPDAIDCHSATYILESSRGSKKDLFLCKDKCRKKLKVITVLALGLQCDLINPQPIF